MSAPGTGTQNDAQVGMEVDLVRRELIAACDMLVGLFGDEIAERIEPLRTRLAGYMARIALVGQVKAGKTALANCLVQQSELLPSDINPWTSVVTKLHFGHPSGMTDGALFHFFDDVQWDRLANRAGRLGELTEGLLEDYKRKELLDQVRAMQERARLRLSDSFEALLGQSHRFKAVTREVIERYVCAGEVPEERLRNPAAGRFSDITHTAEIFFEMAPFGCPVSLMDTPGTNDPLLIREEITHQSLETADLFVVVLSAHQALSESDLNLVRILRALKRNQIIAFVNRIDEVSHLVDDFDKLRKRVAARLKSELGGIDVPVILGSAAWGSQLLGDGDDSADRGYILQVAAQKRRTADATSTFPAAEAQAVPDVRLASGIAELEAALSRQIFVGADGDVLGPTYDDLVSLAHQAVDYTVRSLDAVNRGDAAGRGHISSADVVRIRTALDKRVAHGREAMLAEVGRQWTRLEQDLEAAIGDFARQQQARPPKDIKTAMRSGTIAGEVDALRSTLKAIYVKAFGELRDELWTMLRDLNFDQVADVSEASAQRIIGVRIKGLALISVDARTDALYRSVSLDLSSGWLDSLFTSSAERFRPVIEAVGAQFSDMCTELLATGRDELMAETESAITNFVSDIRRMLRSLAADRAYDGATFASAAQKQAAERSVQEARAIVARLDRLQGLVGTQQRVAVNG